MLSSSLQKGGLPAVWRRATDRSGGHPTPALARANRCKPPPGCRALAGAAPPSPPSPPQNAPQSPVDPCSGAHGAHGSLPRHPGNPVSARLSWAMASIYLAASNNPIIP